MPLVPVVSFWSDATSISTDRLAQAVAGSDPTYSKVVVLTGTGDAVDRALGISRAGLGASNPLEVDHDELVRSVGEGALGLVPLPDVTPTVRALALDGVSLFGNGRVSSLDEWPLFVQVTLPAFEWDQSKTWTLAAGGDVVFDRSVAQQFMEGMSVDFPWDGGTVSITGHHCCTTHGYPQVETQRTGNDGAVRDLLSGADIALANLEGPVMDAFKFHEHGFTFTGDPRLLKGADNAGLDFFSLANNHFGNGGVAGVRDTIRYLDELGIAHAGAGVDIEAAAAPAYFDVGQTRVAVISCTDLGGFRAREDQAGMLHCRAPETLAAIAAARANADTVIVFPHWGVEYRARPTDRQRSLAAAWAEAGVDLVLGSHPHWAAAIETVGDTFVFYCLGNLVFDQDWSEMTLEGLIPELTFQGGRLVQAWPHPTLILHEAQPNLLDYHAGGDVVLDRVRRGSEGLFPY